MLTAITGGIGSGKSYVRNLLEGMGVAVYDCDAAAKRLMLTSRELQRKLSEAVGRDIMSGGRLDKRLLSQFIVASEENAQRVDSIVHPAVAEDFLRSGMEWLESAILFESGFFRRVHFDRIVCVTAPLETRIRRIMERDNLTRERALEWVGRQMPQEEKLRRSDFEIVNDGFSDVKSQLSGLLAATGETLDFKL